MKALKHERGYCQPWKLEALQFKADAGKIAIRGIDSRIPAISNGCSLGVYKASRGQICWQLQAGYDGQLLSDRMSANKVGRTPTRLRTLRATYPGAKWS